MVGAEPKQSCIDNPVGPVPRVERGASISELSERALVTTRVAACFLPVYHIRSFVFQHSYLAFPKCVRTRKWSGFAFAIASSFPHTLGLAISTQLSQEHTGISNT
jgi:hypothetical protein